MSRHGAENDQRLPGEAFCADCPDREGCSQAVPCWLARQAAGMPRERHIIPPAPCCAPDGDEEHCNHHPEWSDAHGCNHPDCQAARPIPPSEPR